MRLPIVLGLLAASAAWPAAWQQTPPPAGQTPPSQLTFRVEGNYIEVDAVVTDSQGRFVRDLKANDFEVLEDKKPRTVDLFSLVDIPLERADAPLYRTTPVESDVVTNEKPIDGRVYVLVLDANHVAPNNTLVTKRAAHEFIDQYIGANDLAAVVLLQTGRSNDNPALHSDAHDHLAADHRAVAGGAHEDALILERHRLVGAVRRRRRKCQRRGALPDIEEWTFDIGLRVGNRLRILLRRPGEEACDLVFQRRRARRCRRRRHRAG